MFKHFQPLVPEHIAQRDGSLGLLTVRKAGEKFPLMKGKQMT